MFNDLFLYFFVFIVTSIIFDFACKKKKSNKYLFNILYFIALLIVTLFIGLRYNVGTDFDNYVSLYGSIIRQDFNSILNSNIEIGHYLICKTTELIFGNAQGMIILYALLTNFSVMLAIEKTNKKYYGISYLIFALNTIPFTLNGMRQGLALSILFIAFNFILNKKTFGFILSCMIASLFHTSALVFLPFGLIYIFMGDKYKNKYNIFLCVFIITIIFSGQLFKLPFLMKYTNYLTGDSTAGYLKILIRLPILIILLLASLQKDKNINFMSTLVFIGFAFMLMGYKANYLDRLSIYFESLIIFIVPHLITNFKTNKNKLLIVFILMYYYFSLFILYYYINGYHDIFPYNFIRIGAFL